MPWWGGVKREEYDAARADAERVRAELAEAHQRVHELNEEQRRHDEKLVQLAEGVNNKVAMALILPLPAGSAVALNHHYGGAVDGAPADAAAAAAAGAGGDDPRETILTPVIPEHVKDQVWFRNEAAMQYTCSPAQWTLDLSSEEMQEIILHPSGVRTFVIIGEFGVGKTWLTRRLACGPGETAGFEGATVHTDGLQGKIGNFHGKKVLIIDSKGFNSPLALNQASPLLCGPGGASSDELQFRGLLLSRQDNVEQNLSVALAGVAFVVVNQIARTDVDRIHEIRRCMDAANEGAQLFVIHNLNHIRTAAELIAVWEEVQKAFMIGATGRMPTLEGVSGDTDPIIPIEMFLDKGPLAARHFFFVREEFEGSWGYKYNEASLTAMKSTIQAICPDDTKNIFSDVQGKLKSQMGKVIETHLQNCQGIELVESSKKDVFRFVAQHSCACVLGLDGTDVSRSLAVAESFRKLLPRTGPLECRVSETLRVMEEKESTIFRCGELTSSGPLPLCVIALCNSSKLIGRSHAGKRVQRL